MNQMQPKHKKVVNTLSVRLPPDLYNKVAEIALERGTTLNSVFIELVDSGLNFKAREQQILENFIVSVVTPERLKELINGQPQIRITT
jgi:predicted DNA-binding protein